MESPLEHQFHARHFATQQPITVAIDGDKIRSITSFDGTKTEAEGLPFVSPGFFDIQINGYGGTWFSSDTLTVDQVVTVTQSLVDKGIAKFFPTLITASFETLRHGFSILRKACESNALVASCVAGYHLEGPYISAEDGPRGAHSLRHVRPADWTEFSKLQTASGNRIRLVTLAAESQNAVEFIGRCRDSGVVVALGHMAANSQQIQTAVQAGAQLSTHFGNGAHGTLPRHPNYLWDQLAQDGLWASVIADGWHLPDALLQCVLKCKTAERTVLTCDVSGFAGCPPGRYDHADLAVEILEDGRLVVADQRQLLAGSGATTGDCIVGIMRACGVSLADALRMATINPGRLLNEPISAIEVGQTATVSVFRLEPKLATTRKDPTFVPIATYINGQLMGGTPRETMQANPN